MVQNGQPGHTIGVFTNDSAVKPTCVCDWWPELDRRLSGLVWTAMFVSAAITITVPRRSGLLTLIAATIIRLIFSIGLEPTLFLLGALNVINFLVWLIL
jgi:hypothetical protein